jgi:glucose/arabinose dehydrogenase
MKKLAVLVSTLMVAGAAFAAQSTETKTAPSTEAKKAPTHHATTKTHIVEAEVVSADVAAKTLTVKGDPQNMTVKVDTAAAAKLKTVKAGEKVKLTCRDNDKGEHLGISHITIETAPAAKTGTAPAPKASTPPPAK